MKMEWRFVLGCLVVLAITSQAYVSADSSDDDDDDGGYDIDQLLGTFSEAEHDKRELDFNVRAMEITMTALKRSSGCDETTCPDDCLLSYIDEESSFDVDDYECPPVNRSIQKRAGWWKKVGGWFKKNGKKIWSVAKVIIGALRKKKQ